MTPKERAAMQQALEALERASAIMDSHAQQRQDDAITALREALAEQEKPLYRKVLREMLDAHEQAEQSQLADATLEPVACKSVPIEPTEDMLLAAELSQPRGYRELYVAMISAAPQPVKEVELTDDEMLNAFEKAACHETYRMLDGCKAVIAAYKEKNK